MGPTCTELDVPQTYSGKGTYNAAGIKICNQYLGHQIHGQEEQAAV